MTDRHFGRKLAHLGRIGIAASAFALPFAACGEGQEVPVKPIVSPVPTLSPKVYDTPTVSPLDPFTEARPLIEKDYPEITNLGTPPKDAVRLRNMLVPTNVFNLTQYKFDPVAAENAYQFLEKLAPRPIRIGAIKTANGQIKDIVFQFDATTRARNMFLIGEEGPRPSWEENGFKFGNTPGATRKDPKGINLSFAAYEDVYVKEYGDDKALVVSKVFLTEACQSTIVGYLVDSVTGKAETNISESLKAQELVCNSLSIAMYARMTGMSYAQYESFRRRQVLKFPQLGLMGEEAAPVPETVYNRIPVNIRVLK